MKLLALGLLVVLAAVILLVSMPSATIASAEYPGLLDAYDLAPEDRRQAMRSVVAEEARRREIFAFSPASRDRFLEAGGYCTSRPVPSCRPAPKGTEAEGLAIERFAYVARWGTSHAQEEPCHPRRCPPAASDIIAAPVPAAQK